jgi:ketosteroid isomerase-like protein
VVRRGGPFPLRLLQFDCARPLAGGRETQTDSGKFIEVWARQPDGSWLIADDIFNSNLPVPSS